MEYNSKQHDDFEKNLGKITSAKFGLGGYQDVQMGLNISFSIKGGDGSTFVDGGWDYSNIDVTKYTKWDEDDRSKSMANMCKEVSQILNDAKCSTVDQLIGKPIEVSVDFNTFKSWRILEEVL